MLKIIPVIDILNGVVVHAVKGRRSEYQPLKSTLCASTDPLDVALAFKALGFSELYVADLDAIAGKRENFSILKQIADTAGLRLMVDAGIADLERAKKVLKSQASKIIIGTETLTNISLIAEAVKLFGNEKVVVSLDLMGDRVLNRLEVAALTQPLALLRTFQEAGVSQIIVLDLARVGSGEGVNVSFLKDVLRNITVNVYVGGGVRDIEDLAELKTLGVFGVLIATALHSGKISLEELGRVGLIS